MQPFGELVSMSVGVFSRFSSRNSFKQSEWMCPSVCFCRAASLFVFFEPPAACHVRLCTVVSLARGVVKAEHAWCSAAQNAVVVCLITDVLFSPVPLQVPRSPSYTPAPRPVSSPQPATTQHEL